jgi:hypothetical protein
LNWKRPLRDTLIMLGGVVAVMFVASWALNGLGNPNDIQNYYEVNLGHPYHEPYLGTSSFVYSPPAALLVSWLHLLPFPFVATAQRLLQSAALLVLAGPFTPIAIFTPQVASELNLGNINIYLALLAIAGLRWPKLWSLVLITKPSCAVGLLWFVARRDWAALRGVLAMTAGFVIVSVILIPQAWVGYFGVVTHPAPTLDGMPVLWLRLPIAAVVAVVGSLRTWRPAIVISVWLGLPVWELVSPVVLVGLLAFLWQSPVLDPAWRRGPADTQPPRVKATRFRGQSAAIE